MTSKIEELVDQAEDSLQKENIFWHVEPIPVDCRWFPDAGVKLYHKSSDERLKLTTDTLEALIQVVKETKKQTIDDYVIPWADGLYVQQVHPLLLNTAPKTFKKYEIDGQLPDVNPKIAELIETRIKKV